MEKTGNFKDVDEFNRKFNHLHPTTPQHLTKRKLEERIEFMLEELTEFAIGCGLDIGVYNGRVEVLPNSHQKLQNMAEQADALVDLVYVALGTAVQLGLPWQELWDDVHRANMEKVPGVTHRGHPVDCIKPEGWVPPYTKAILLGNSYDKNKANNPEFENDD